MSAEVTPEMQRAALEWQAAEHHEQARVERQVAELQDAENPAPEQTPEQAAAQQTAAVVSAAMPQLCTALWRVLDRVVAQNLLGPQCAATGEELAELGRLTVPVLEKYLPGALSQVLTTPEGVLLGSAALIYGSKMLAAPPAPAAPPTSEAPPA